MIIESGNISVTSADDAIRSDPESVDASLGLAGLITVTGGNITIAAGSDGIQVAQDIVISGGNFNITTGAGYNDSSFDKDTMSCKGIKASFNTDDTTDTSESTNTITITGGTFILNCADDAIHSDAYISITGGDFSIRTGDDAVHADTTLNIGTQNGADDAVNINVITSYEGLEAGTVNIYSGIISVYATDDGINAAGGSDTSDQPGQGFNPGGGWNPGGPGGQGGTSASSDYSINIYGGDVYVNVDGDGLDSNGDLNLSGGYVVVWGQKSGGDNEPLDCDGSLTINGATVFAAGSSSMMTSPKNSQKYITSRTSFTSGKTINIKYNNSAVYSIKAVKNINYVLYSSPNMSSTTGWSISSDSSAVTDPYVTSVSVLSLPDSTSYITGDEPDFTGLVLSVGYSDGKTLRIGKGYTAGGYDKNTAGTQAVTITYEGYSAEFEITYTDAYRAYFNTDSSLSVNVYYTENYSSPDETGASSALVRDSAGKADVSGSGAVIFSLEIESGYSLGNLDVEGDYSSITDISADSGIENTYKVTGISGNITVSAETVKNPYAASFIVDSGASVNVYYTKDYSVPDETNVISTLARNSTTGETDTTGDGQVNFAVVVPEGYAVDSVAVNGSYKNIKDISETEGVLNLYRITKVASDIEIIITLKEVTYLPVVFEAKEGSTTVIENIDGVNYIYGLAPGLTSEEFLENYISYENALISFSSGIATGCTVTVTAQDSGIKDSEYIIVIFGDIDADGYYDAQDATLALSLSTGLLSPEKLGAAANMAADCNHDGTIDSGDAEILIQAGALLSSVDQSKNSGELESDSVYGEYLNIIDQTLRTAEDNTAGETEETADSTVETEKSGYNIFNLIIEFISAKINKLLSFFKITLG